MQLSQFGYNLPQNLIAQKPIKPRDHCRLLVIDRHCEERPQGATKPARLNGHLGRQSYFKHLKFFEIEKFLQKGDVLVLNDSKVISARIYGKKITKGNVEILLIKKISSDTWEAMLKNFKLRESGKKIIISSSSSHSSLSSSRIRGSRPESNIDSRLPACAGRRGNDSAGFSALPIKSIGDGLWQIKFNLKGAALDKAIHKYGHAPLPPYIKSSAKLADYQTIYAKKDGSVASPTAGLHFTKRLINKLKKKGVIFETITLHVGLGTFAPIRAENIEKHKIHSEYAEIPAKTTKAINKAKSEGRRVIAVGTTSARTLESFASSTHDLRFVTSSKIQDTKIDKNRALYDHRMCNCDSIETGYVKNRRKQVDIFIKPGYKFKIVDGMITNFHLPKTTLMILVSAFARRDKIMRAYQEAIEKKYRFFSFGDAMLII